MKRYTRLLAPALIAIAAATPALADVIYYGEVSIGPSPTHRIVRALSGGSASQVVVIQGASINSIALDPDDGRMYWLSQDGIRRANLDGSAIEHIVPGALGSDLEIDTLGGKIYWRGGTIERANLDGSDVELLLDPTTSAGGGIAVHGPSGKLFWADNNFPLNDEIPNEIRRADLDGTNSETILALDEWLLLVNLEANSDDPGSRLFWFQWAMLGSGATGLASSNLDGSNYTPVDVQVSFEDPPLAVTDDKVYWTLTACAEPGCQPTQIYRSNLNGSAEEFLFQIDGLMTAMDVDDTSSSIPVPALTGHAGGLLALLLLGLSGALLLRWQRASRTANA